MPRPRRTSSPAQQSRPLKRTASVASSLPTPPRTTRRRGTIPTRAKGQENAKSRTVEQSTSQSRSNADGAAEDEDDAGVVQGQAENESNRAKRQKTLPSLSEETEDEDAFWMGGAKLRPPGLHTPNDESHSSEDKSPPPPALARYRARVEDKSAASLASPPPSRRQAQVPKTPTFAAGSGSPRRSARLMQMSDTRTGGLERDSPENPFLARDDVAPGSPETPTPIIEKPTILYVFRGVRRTYANPHYDPTDPTQSRVKPQSLLPVEHPDYSPDQVCKPTMLFKTERRRRALMKRPDPMTPLPKSTGKESVKRTPSDDEEEDGDLLPLKPLKLEAAAASTLQKTNGASSLGKRPANTEETEAPAAAIRAGKSPRLT